MQHHTLNCNKKSKLEPHHHQPHISTSRLKMMLYNAMLGGELEYTPALLPFSFPSIGRRSNGSNYVKVSRCVGLGLCVCLC